MGAELKKMQYHCMRPLSPAVAYLINQTPRGVRRWTVGTCTTPVQKGGYIARNYLGGIALGGCR